MPSEAALQRALYEAPSLHDLSARAAMGLPDRFVERMSPELADQHQDLRGCTPIELAGLIEDVRAQLDRRRVAGLLLGLGRDPRIHVDSPVMIDVPEGVVHRGTSPDAVAAVIARWGQVGVRAEWILKETPASAVPMVGFRIGKYPVTNLEWREFCLDAGDGAALPTSWPLGVYPVGRSNHPVSSVDEGAADAYARWLSTKTGRRFRLPTEFEWEYAARGSDTREFPWGDDWRPDLCNTVEGGPLDTTPVGLYPGGASAWGVLDMAGNVEEYVADEYRAYPGGETVADDLAATWGSYRVTRGGSCTRFGDLARCARRHGRYPGSLYPVGLRLAEDAQSGLPKITGTRAASQTT